MADGGWRISETTLWPVARGLWPCGLRQCLDYRRHDRSEHIVPLLQFTGKPHATIDVLPRQRVFQRVQQLRTVAGMTIEPTNRVVLDLAGRDDELPVRRLQQQHRPRRLRQDLVRTFVGERAWRERPEP